MKIVLITLGKTEDSYLITGIDKYVKRLKHYTRFSIIEIPELRNTKNLSEDQQKEKEAELVLSKIQNTDYLILLDERGKSFSSVEFAGMLEKLGVRGISSLVFVTGGPYGFSEQMYKRANETISLSKMTFSHQMVRLFFVEQIYRAFTILKGEPYHHE